MDFRLEIKPAIIPKVRHEIEDVLKSHGFDVHGGGTYTNMQSCDITFSQYDSRDGSEK